ncbi:MAG: hypothetical protein JO147_07060, partial [Actinobacteria bacterium]|nr:hypothetical protein [Actinomycetota bacterium]
GDGVLIAQHCADGDHVLLRDAYAGDDDSGKNSPVKWRQSGAAVVPISADNLISALPAAGGALRAYRSNDGGALGQIALDPGVDASALGASARERTPIATSGTNGAVYLWIAGRTWAIGIDARQQLWSVATTGPAQLSDGKLFSTTTQGIVELDPATGQPRQSWAVGSLPHSATVYPAGTGFLLGGSQTSMFR